MLRELVIENIAVIERADVEFSGGLSVLSGETGAGKSILLGALSLLMGAKADASVISEGAQNCVVEAEFEIDGAESVKKLLEDNDVDWDGGHLLIRRVVNSTGRSRSFVNDSPVNIQLLGQISSRLVDIHSQHQSLILTDRSFQLSTLDFFAGDSELLASCKKAWAEYRKLQEERSLTAAQLKELSAEKEYNEAQFRQLEAASLRDGELEELEEEQRRLANAEEIKEILCQVENISEPSADMPSLDSQLRAVSQLLAKVSKYVPQTESLSERVSSARIELADVMDEVSSVNAGISVSEERLSAVEDRMSLLYALLKKHSCTDIAGLIQVRDHFSEAVTGSEILEGRLHDLDVRIAAAGRRLESASLELHNSRAAAVPRFASAVTRSLHFLELDRAVFGVELKDTAISASGSDEVVFTFSASGRAPADLSKCASGGELSRIMLSLKALLAEYTEMPTMIFDEIDTGVSGSAADRMGSMICDMGRHMQVFAITHLPQVAAKGDAHYMVSKDTDASGRSVSSIKKLDREGRVMEVARMLSGSAITEAAVANAESLLLSGN